MFNVYWDKLTGTSTSIKIAFEADATSWASLGIGGSSPMNGIDAQVAMVLSGATSGILLDTKSSGTSRPAEDGANSNTNILVSSTNGVLLAEFERNLVAANSEDNTWDTGSNSLSLAIRNGAAPSSQTSYAVHNSRVRTTIDFSADSTCTQQPGGSSPASPPPPGTTGNSGGPSPTPGGTSSASSPSSSLALTLGLALVAFAFALL